MDDYKKILQEKFSSFEPSPSRDLWPEISEEIRPRKRFGYWPYAVAAVLALLLLFGSLWWRPFGEQKPTARETLAIEETTPTQVSPHSPASPVDEAPGQDQPAEKKAEKSSKLQPTNTKSSLSANSMAQASIQPGTVKAKEEKPSPQPSTDARPSIQTASVPAPARLTVEAPELLFIAPKVASRQAEELRPLRAGSHSELNLSEIKATQVAAFASTQLDRLGVKSPIHFEEQVQQEKKSKKRRFQVVLGNFSLTRTTYKPIYKN